jgi:amino acid permease
MKIETIGKRIGFLTGMILFITIFYLVLNTKFKWLPNYLSYYNILFLSVVVYISYNIIHGVHDKWKK